MLTRVIAVMLVLAVAAPAASTLASVLPPEPIDIHVSILPQSYLASRVGGEFARVHTLVPVGQSPHSFELTPRQMAELAASRAYFAVGLPFEERVLGKLVRMGSDLVIIDTSDRIPKRRMDSADGHEGAAAHADGSRRPDPHVWLSPRLARVIAEDICAGLIEIDPNHAPDYEANLELLLEDLDRLDDEIARMLAPYAGRSFYVFHPAFGYFADAYGLTQTPIETAGKEPGIRDLISFVEKARADGVTTIFVQLQFPERTAEAVAAEIGATVVALDPLESDYLSGLKRIAEGVRAALASPEAPGAPETE